MRIQWPSGSAVSHESGHDGEYPAGFYDFVLDGEEAKSGNWHLWMVDDPSRQIQISNDVFVQTTTDCTGDGAANVVEVNFRRHS